VSETVILWIFGAVIGALTLTVSGLFRLLWDHVDKCKEITAKLSRAEAQILNLEKDQQGIRNWKHVVVDPYVPRAVEEHERRINRLDQKMDER
jgi:hypothetical protein